MNPSGRQNICLKCEAIVVAEKALESLRPIRIRNPGPALASLLNHVLSCSLLIRPFNGMQPEGQ
jgi:hypothetical protein